MVRESEVSSKKTLRNIFRKQAIEEYSKAHVKGALLHLPFYWGRIRRPVPWVPQTTATECGASCLAMILQYYGKDVQLAVLRDELGAHRDGTDARWLVEISETYGLRAYGACADLHEMHLVQVPAIIHWEFKHFMVLERWTAKGAFVVDPGMGRRFIPRNEFSAGYTGVVLIMEPGESFIREKRRTRPWRRYLSISIQAWRTMARVFTVSLLLQILGLALPLVTSFIVDRAIPNRSFSILTTVGAGLFALMAVYAVTSIARGFLLIQLQASLDKKMMLDFFEHLLSLPFPFFQQRSTGDLLMRLSSNNVVREILSNQLTSAALDGLLILFYFAAMVYFHPKLAMAVLAIAAAQVALVVLSILLVKELVKRDISAQSKSQSYLVEALRGIETVKVTASEHRVFDYWSKLFVNQLNTSIARQKVSTVMSALLGTLGLASPIILLLFGAAAVLNGTITLGAMLGFNALAAAFLGPLSRLVSISQSLQVVGTHFQRLEEINETPSEQAAFSLQRPGALQGNIFVNDISFRYSTHSPYIVQGISLRVLPGQMVALVGPTGSGKSTLAKLLLALYEPTSGSVLYDGMELKDMNYKEVRRQLGIVLQGRFMFNASIRSNIALVDPEMPIEKVTLAAKLAEIHEEIEAMPMGYETLLGEMANNLSGGQLQRICIARALAHMPKILLLDEATSELDGQTESRIYNNLCTRDCTRIVIAHRLSTIRNADQIIVLENGKIAEHGTHRDLVATNGLYGQLVAIQRI